MYDIVIISGLPVLNEENQARYAELGLGGIDWPPPYKNSVKTACEQCDSAMWLGPESHQMYLRLIAAGEETPWVCCMICCAMMQRAGADVSVIKLTGKDSRKGE